ncbi:mucin-3B-like isoform X3 [Pelobates cultripes]|nr:mucin-3B-like isoform X3 [Pelobates cultripes]
MCHNGGTYDGIKCICLDQFYGPSCESMVDNVEVDNLCHNGGTYDGVKCICLDQFYGPSCESVVDRVEVGGKVNTTVIVNLRITNMNYTSVLSQTGSHEYYEFIKNFKLEMQVFYKDLPGYKDVIVISLSQGSVYVKHEVIVEAEYNENESVIKQYEEILQKVNQVLENFRNNNCTSESNGSKLCIDVDNSELTAVFPKSEKDRCNEVVQSGFQEHFQPIVVNNSLICVSSCSPNSKSYLNCHDGTCQLQKVTGAHCLCPKTETYVYTSQGCQGKILKAGLYGGIGAGIAALVIFIFTLSFFMFRKHQKKHTLFKDDDKSWYEDYDDEWSVERGITNLSEAVYEDYQQRFRPALENVDTTTQVKIQRPEVLKK